MPLNVRALNRVFTFLRFDILHNLGLKQHEIIKVRIVVGATDIQDTRAILLGFVADKELHRATTQADIVCRQLSSNYVGESIREVNDIERHAADCRVGSIRVQCLAGRTDSDNRVLYDGKRSRYIRDVIVRGDVLQRAIKVNADHIARLLRAVYIVGRK